jgi:hypothetical protein
MKELRRFRKKVSLKEKVAAFIKEKTKRGIKKKGLKIERKNTLP